MSERLNLLPITFAAVYPMQTAVFLLRLFAALAVAASVAARLVVTGCFGRRVARRSLYRCDRRMLVIARLFIGAE